MSRSSTTVLVAVSLAMGATGCFSERFYGISRMAKLAHADPDCIGTVLRQMPGITHVDELYRNGVGRELIRVFRYEGRGCWAHLSLTREGDRITFLHERVSMRERPSGKELARTRQMMLRVEELLIKECHLDELTTGLDEEGYGVK